MTPFSKAVRSMSMIGMVADNQGGYVRFVFAQANVGVTRKGPYVHFMKLDGKLKIKSQSDTYLSLDDKTNIQPVAGFETGKYLTMVTASSDEGLNNLHLAYWQFDLENFTVVKKNVSLVSFPFNKNKDYEFRYYRTKDLKKFGLTILEEGKKKEASILHCVSLNDDFSTNYKRSITLPFSGRDGNIVQTVITSNGNICTLLSYPARKKDDFLVSDILVASKDQEHLIPFLYKEEPVINCAIGLSGTGDLMAGGMTSPSKKGYITSFVLGKIRNGNKWEFLKEEVFTESLLTSLNKADKRGVRKDYHVRSISGRANGTVDVIVHYCLQERNFGGGTNTTVYDLGEISDALIFSYENEKLVSTIPIKRNLEYNGRTGTKTNPQYLGISKVFTIENDLYLMYFDNPSNTIGINDGGKIKSVDFTKGTFKLARIDKNNKPTQQQLIQFERHGHFSLFYDLDIHTFNEKKYILSTDKYKFLSKNVRTESILLELN